MKAAIHIQRNLHQAKALVRALINRRNKFYEKTNLINFSFLLTIEHFVVVFIVYMPLELTTSTVETLTAFDKFSNVRLFVMAVLIAPILETIIFQFSIIELLKKIISNKFICGTISAFIFGYIHIDNGQNSIYYATISGLYLSWGYNHWTTHSRAKAIISTAIQHALYNLTIFTIAHP